jgi:hypothetical protein
LLDLETANNLAGIRITQTAGNASVLKFEHVAGQGGHNYGIYSSGSNNPNPGSLEIFDHSGGGSGQSRLFIHSGGNIGIGTRLPGTAKLAIETQIQGNTVNTEWGTTSNLIQVTSNGGSNTNDKIGLEACASTFYPNENFLFGVRGFATDGLKNVGGYFEAYGHSDSYPNYGVQATAGGNMDSWACRFDGATFSTTQSWNGSDRKLKENIVSLSGSLEKIKALNPVSYNFKKDKEFKDLRLPEEKQLGLIAQELEKVFPEMVKDMPADERTGRDGKKTITPGFKAVQYQGLIALLISGIQEQQRMIEDVQTRLAVSDNNTGNANSINQINSAANGFAMDQNIPNPFNNETVIKYTLTGQSKTATLNVYDLSGKQLASFPLEISSSSITITSEKLAAGIYIYSIVADGKIMDSKRMVVAEK